jgi:hypothetical protein
MQSTTDSLCSMFESCVSSRTVPFRSIGKYEQNGMAAAIVSRHVPFSVAPIYCPL